MLRYLIYRVALMIPTLIAISIITFIIIQLPPGDFLSAMMHELAAQGEGLAQQRIEYLRNLYGLDDPIWLQYLNWITGFVQGDLGWSFQYDRPVREVIGDRFLMTTIVAFATVLVTWVLAFPIGWLISHVILAVLFYGILTPVGFMFRLIGRDPLSRRRAAVAPATYWTAKRKPASTREYFNQF